MSLTEQPEISNELVRKGMRSYHFSVIIEKDQDGHFAFCPELQGCYTQGYAYEEVLSNIRDVIRLHVEDRLESGEEIPQPEYVSMTSLEITI
jgi:predicted RNase H-like HicB family nuclease